uniref:Uncharacterized protein n=1 Tax=Arundo donax TaxID=35708 RepID=A0A0A9BTJ8_ARUDO
MMVGPTRRNIVSSSDAASGPRISLPPHMNTCRSSMMYVSNLCSLNLEAESWC